MMITTYRKVYSIEVIFPLYLFCFDLSFSNVVVDEVHLHTFYNTTKNLPGYHQTKSAPPVSLSQAVPGQGKG